MWPAAQSRTLPNTVLPPCQLVNGKNGNPQENFLVGGQESGLDTLNLAGCSDLNLTLPAG